MPLMKRGKWATCIKCNKTIGFKQEYDTNGVACWHKVCPAK